jgi:hypothetical protein
MRITDSLKAYACGLNADACGLRVVNAARADDADSTYTRAYVDACAGMRRRIRVVSFRRMLRRCIRRRMR